jgi:hypothetical protein
LIAEAWGREIGLNTESEKLGESNCG